MWYTFLLWLFWAVLVFGHRDYPSKKLRKTKCGKTFMGVQEDTHLPRLQLNSTVSYCDGCTTLPPKVHPPAPAPASTSCSLNHSAAPPLCRGLSTTHQQAAGWLSSCFGLLGWGHQGEVSVTTCNEICCEHFTEAAAAAAYRHKWSDVRRLQANPAGNWQKRAGQGAEVSLSPRCYCAI